MTPDPLSSTASHAPASEPPRLTKAAAFGRRRLRAVGLAYTRTVGLLKILLPSLAVLIVALLVAWPLLQPDERASTLSDTGELEMLNAHYVGTDKENRPFTVESERAVRSTADPNVMDLVKPEAEMVLKDGTWIVLRAQTGRYNQETGKLLLLGGVRVMHDKGYEFASDEAHVDVAEGTAWGDLPVTGQGPFGELNAEGFRLYDRGRTLVFTGRSNLKLAGKADGTEGTP